MTIPIKGILILILFIFIPWIFCYSQSDNQIQYWISRSENKDLFTRVEAIDALSRFTTEHVIRTLIHIMHHDPEFYLREKAAKSLISIGYPAMDSMLPLLQSDNQEIQYHALWFLQSVSGEDYGFNIRKWTNWWKKKSRDMKN